MAVEWLRASYRSEWRLFRDSALTTKGRYVFVPAGTPHFPGFHNVGSATWDDANWKHVTVLGEVRGTPRIWDDGQAPVVVPRARPLGSLACIAQGELVRDAVSPERCIDGYLPECLIPVAELQRLWELASENNDCALQRMYSFLITALYEDDEDLIAATVLAWLGPIPVVKVYPHTGILPGVITITTELWQVVVLDGTRNFQELALQAVAFVIGPQNRGILSTANLWYDSASYVFTRMQGDGLSAGMRLFFAGHSYGGAVSLCLAARLFSISIYAEIRFLTFGCPKIGDDRFVQILRRMVGTNLVNDDDIISILPPDKKTLLPIALVIGLAGLSVYTEWRRPPFQVGLDELGFEIPESIPFADTDQLVRIIVRAINRQEGQPLVGHQITEYLRRLEIACPDPCWPLNEVVNWDITLPDQAIEFFSPKIPPGTIAMISLPRLVPGHTCAEALLIELNQEVHFNVLGSEDYWWKARLPADGTYKCTLLSHEVNPATNFVYSGIDCDHLTFRGGLGGGLGCRDFTALEGEYIFLFSASRGFQLDFVFSSGTCF